MGEQHGMCAQEKRKLDPADLNKAVLREHFLKNTIEDIATKVAWKPDIFYFGRKHGLLSN